MSPIEYIKVGIVEGSWETFCQVYKRLTGDSLPIPRTMGTESVLKQITDFIDGLQTVPKQTETKMGKKKVGRPKKSKKTTKNTVDEDGEDASLKLDDEQKNIVMRNTGGVRLITNDPDPKEVEQNRIKAARTNRSKVIREAPKTYDVECNECRQTFKSGRKEGKMGQKCPQCLNQLKGRYR